MPVQHDLDCLGHFEPEFAGNQGCSHLSRADAGAEVARAAVGGGVAVRRGGNTAGLGVLFLVHDAVADALADVQLFDAVAAGKFETRIIVGGVVLGDRCGHAVIEDDALEFLADVSGGDARNALNAIELGVLTTDRSEDGQIHITLDVASECIQKRVVNYDKKGDNHYDIISAFIKSMRGSDPDAAVFYLAKMLYAGEDVKFIARRIMICASEDVGNADPMALTVAVAAAQAVERIGMPESQIILSQAVTYVASAPKSNSAVNAIFAANDAVRNNKTTVPTHLQDAHYKGAQKLGHGTGYKYAHDYPNHYVDQQYLPDEIKDARFYEPGDLGYEKQIRERLQKLREQ